MNKKLTQLVVLLLLPSGDCSLSSPVGRSLVGHPGILGIDTRRSVDRQSPAVRTGELGAKYQHEETSSCPARITSEGNVGLVS